MGLAYSVRRGKEPVIVAWDGTISLEEWRAHLRRLLAEPDYLAAKSQMRDLRYAVLDSSITDDTIASTVDALAAELDKVPAKKVAIVAGTQWAQYKAAEASLLRLGMAPIVFNDLPQACDWLNVDPEEVGGEIKRLRMELRGSSQGRGAGRTG